MTMCEKGNVGEWLLEWRWTRMVMGENAMGGMVMWENGFENGDGRDWLWAGIVMSDNGYEQEWRRAGMVMGGNGDGRE
ncbi:hypothetical protein CDAR_41991 [Caerostris darwini]|uniref:Uncharacterized protein n=1 Tax=Caerostris darwini TaxID=1538125 RepID=A0AAV4RGC7_9ARAC|nr:hypothetical protein CDAR_41991 [Caerostris darwini]